MDRFLVKIIFRKKIFSQNEKLWVEKNCQGSKMSRGLKKAVVYWDKKTQKNTKNIIWKKFTGFNVLCQAKFFTLKSVIWNKIHAPLICYKSTKLHKLQR